MSKSEITPTTLKAEQGRVMRVALAVLLALALTACRQPHTAQADNRILWSERGCAFHVEPHWGDTSFVTRLPDANKPTCPTQEAQP